MCVCVRVVEGIETRREVPVLRTANETLSRAERRISQDEVEGNLQQDLVASPGPRLG